MSAPQSLLLATFNRLSARLSSGLADTLASLASLAEGAPERLQQEWELFVQEVELEADRLERGDTTPESPDTPTAAGEESPPSPQEQIDALRARVARLAARLEDRR